MEKNWVPFFPAKIRVFLGSILKNLTEIREIREKAIIKMIKTSVAHHFLWFWGRGIRILMLEYCQFKT